MEWQASPSSVTRPALQRSIGGRTISAHLKGTRDVADERCTSSCHPAKSAASSSVVPRALQDSTCQSERSSAPTKFITLPARSG